MFSIDPHMSRLTAAVVAGLILSVAQANTAAADVVERSFDVSPGGRLTAETDIGSFSIRSGGGNSVDIRVRRDGRSEDYLELEFEHDGADVKIIGEYTDRDRNWGRRTRVHFDIQVPQTYDLDIRTAGGSIDVDDLNGEIRARTAGGSLSFGQIYGSVVGRTSGGSISLDGTEASVDVDTSGGSISIGNVGGEVRARTSGGSIDIGQVRGKVDARTSGGSIEVREAVGGIEASTSGGSVTAYLSEQPVADSRLSTSGGSVTAYLAGNLALSIDAHASGGRVRSDFDLGERDPYRDGERRTRLRGDLNGGGPRLELEATGNISIRRK